MIAKIRQRRKEGGGLDRLVAALFQQAKGQGQRGASNTIANRVDLLFACDRFGGIDGRQISVFYIVFQSDPRIGGVGIDPADDEQGVTLIHQPFDHAVLFLEIKDIELVDPRREQHQRRLVHGFSGGRVLDQFHHLVAEHNLARRGSNVDAQFERLVIRQLDDQFAIVGFQIGNQVLKPLHQ